MLSIYMSVDRFNTDDGYASELRRFVDYVKSSKPATPDGEVLVPGEPEYRMRTRRLDEGIPLARDTWAVIVQAGESVGVTAPAGNGENLSV